MEKQQQKTKKSASTKHTPRKVELSVSNGDLCFASAVNYLTVDEYPRRWRIGRQASLAPLALRATSSFCQ
jgi:hypothetical protein